MNQNLKETKVHGTTEYPFALYRMNRFQGPFHVSLHWHDEMEIVYIEKGELSLTIGKTDYKAGAGDLFIINSREIHQMNIENPDICYYTILFPLASLIFEATDNVNRRFLLPLAEHKLLFCRRLTDTPAHPLLLECVRSIIRAYYSESGSRQLFIRTQLLLFICRCYEHGCFQEPSQPPRYGRLNLDILAYVNEHYAQDIRLDAIAAQFHMVPKYFSRYFKNTFHTTFTAYVNHLRLEKAAELLDSTALTVTEIALQSGFSSCSYFNRCFREAFGLSPLSYRRRETSRPISPR